MPKSDGNAEKMKEIPNLIKNDWLAVSRLLASAQYINSGMDSSWVQELYLCHSLTYASELNDGRGVQDHHKSNGDRWRETKFRLLPYWHIFEKKMAIIEYNLIVYVWCIKENVLQKKPICKIFKN